VKSERQHLQTPLYPGAGDPVRPRPTRHEDLDPRRSPRPDDVLDDELRLADQTPGLDEAHAIPGHPNYTPGGPPCHGSE
jgi:hypothetical protein